MNGSERYKTDADFRRALEQRLATAAHKGTRGLVRERQVFVFERFLARAVAADLHVVIKGGMALELRTQQARTTRDIDLRAMGSPDAFEQSLFTLGTNSFGDFLSFRVERHARPQLDALGMKYPGRRYRVQAWLAGKVYGDPFGVDVAFGEPMLGAPERLYGRCDLSFIGLEAPAFPVSPRTTHIAEKLHAYSVPRPTPNSRVRDLPDLAILASLGPLERHELRDAIQATFAHRATHAVPAALAPAPERWRLPYRELADANRLVWVSLTTCIAQPPLFSIPFFKKHRRCRRGIPRTGLGAGSACAQRPTTITLVTPPFHDLLGVSTRRACIRRRYCRVTLTHERCWTQLRRDGSRMFDVVARLHRTFRSVVEEL